MRKPRPIETEEIILKAADTAREATIDVFYVPDDGCIEPCTLAKLRRIHKWIGNYIAWLESR